MFYQNTVCNKNKKVSNKQENSDNKNDIYLPAGKTPQVLLLGNGLNRCFGGNSWDELIKNFPNKNIIPAYCNIPYPMKIILATDNHIKKNLEKEKDTLKGKEPKGDLKKYLEELLKINFSDILTTNYSYELEQVNEKRSDNEIEDMNIFANSSYNGEDRYRELLYTYKKLGDNRIWHIHGEALYPAKTIIIGHYFYGKLLGKIQDYIYERCRGGKNNSNKYEKHNKNPIKLNSWIDSFILGDVYVLGFGFDLSEMDLWWLLNRKYREKANPHGTVYFYEPKMKDFDEKIKLLEIMGVKIINFNTTISSDKETQQKQFEEFYKKAIEDIEKKVSKA